MPPHAKRKLTCFKGKSMAARVRSESLKERPAYTLKKNPKGVGENNIHRRNNNKPLLEKKKIVETFIYLCVELVFKVAG